MEGKLAVDCKDDVIIYKDGWILLAMDIVAVAGQHVFCCNFT